MRVSVVIATRGRAIETRTLLDRLATGTRLPDRVIVVGTEAADVAGLDASALAPSSVRAVLAPTAGGSAQRNHALSMLGDPEPLGGDDLVIFFDDDFRPGKHWLEGAENIMILDPAIVGLTGAVLLDGAPGAAISETCAREALDAWSPAGEELFEVAGLYGCNMALRGSVFDACRFDERLPLYSWLEDRDLSGQARRYGRLVGARGCAGVHLACKSGRTSGRRYGYSQIANPLYLARKGTMAWPTALTFVARALGSNLVRSPREHPLFDYRGRLRGNLLALRDIAGGRITPEAIRSI